MLQEIIKNKTQHYNPKKYCNYREKVVTHDIPDNCVAVGVPDRVIKKV